MLECNIVTELYNQIKKSHYGICFNETKLLSLVQKQMRYDLGCTGVVLCYEPETCIGTTTVSCSLALSQTLITTSCDLVATQSFDDYP
jgi:triosephosphate isomerase